MHPPKLDNGAQLCLSFHIRQGYWSTCRHFITHGITLNAAEKTSVINYLCTQAQHHRPITAATLGSTPVGASWSHGRAQLYRVSSSPEPTINVRSSVTTNELVNKSLTSHSGNTNLATLPQTPSHKRWQTTLQPYSAGELGKWAVQHAQLMERLGWQQYFHC